VEEGEKAGAIHKKEGLLPKSKVNIPGPPGVRREYFLMRDRRGEGRTGFNVGVNLKGLPLDRVSGTSNRKKRNIHVGD